jgi:hypothetical protein
MEEKKENAANQSDPLKIKAQKPVQDGTERNIKNKSRSQSFFKKVLHQFLLAVLFLLIGAGLVFFLVHQPAVKEYTVQKEEITRYQTMEADYNQLLADYADLSTRHEVAVTLVDIYKIQNNVNIARIALMEDNETRLSIALGYVEKDIETLDIGEFPEKVDLSARVTAIKGYLPNNTSKALSELNALFDDLLLLANNMEITE